MDGNGEKKMSSVMDFLMFQDNSGPSRAEKLAAAQQAQEQKLEEARKKGQAAAKEKERAAKAKPRYGSRGVPMTDYLGQAQAGSLKTILGG